MTGPDILAYYTRTTDGPGVVIEGFAGRMHLRLCMEEAEALLWALKLGLLIEPAGKTPEVNPWRVMPVPAADLFFVTYAGDREGFVLELNLYRAGQMHDRLQHAINTPIRAAKQMRQRHDPTPEEDYGEFYDEEDAAQFLESCEWPGNGRNHTEGEI